MATHRAYRQWRHRPSRSEGYGGMMPLAPAKCGWHPLAMATPPLWVRASALAQMSHWPKARLQKLPGSPSAWHRDKSWFSSNGSQSMDLVSRVQIWAVGSVTLLTGGVDMLEAATHKVTWLTASTSLAWCLFHTLSASSVITCTPGRDLQPLKCSWKVYNNTGTLCYKAKWKKTWNSFYGALSFFPTPLKNLPFL